MATHADVVIQAIAAGQHGVVSRAQLLAAGVSRRAVDRRIAVGLLAPLHRGVFRVGPIAAPRMREMAACLACGAAAAVGHRSAAVLWQLLPPRERPGPVEIVVCGRERRHTGVRVRRAGTLRRSELTTLDGIPVTTPIRTLCDLAASVSARELEQAVVRAIVAGLATRPKLVRAMARAAGRRGIATLRALLAGDGPALTRSEAEDRLLTLVRAARLPEPEVNARFAGLEVDFFWRAERLIVEVDGYAFHADRASFENDRRRDLKLTSRGMRVVRVTWRQLVDAPEAVLARLAQALAM